MHKASYFHRQAFAGNNLKYHLIRQMLEQKHLSEVVEIKNEVQE